MGIQTTTNTFNSSQRCWRNYRTKTCTSLVPEAYHDEYRRVESVTSYRGKPMYVQVGGKRRKAFNPFTLWKYRQTPAIQLNWSCVNVKKYAENFLKINMDTHSAVYGSTVSYPLWSGDICPFYKRESMQNYGAELRDFVVRDLFIKANEPVFDGAVFIAELNETLVELKRILLGAANGLRKTATLKKQIKHLALSPEELWLWFRYFLMPAMMDAENIIAAIKPRMKIDRVQDGDKSDGIQTMNGTGHLQLGTGPSPLNIDWESTYRYGCGGAIDMYSRFDPNPYGTSNWDVLRATWERIPWSFVFDWFVNVGDWLSSLRSIEIDYAQSYATFAIEAETKLDFSNWTNSPDIFQVNTVLVDRIVNLEPPTLPLVDKNWGRTLRYIDSISLIIGTLKNVLKRRR